MTVNLSNLVWNRIQDKVIAQLIKEAIPTVFKQRCMRFKDLYEEWHAVQVQEHHEVLPHTIDLLLLPDIREILQSYRYVDDETILSITSRFAHLAEEWRESCATKLRQLVWKSGEHMAGVPADVDILSLASVLFSCSKCKAHHYSDDGNEKLPLYFPRVLEHTCSRDAASWKPMGNCQWETVVHAMCGDCNDATVPWSCDTLEFGVWHRRASSMLRACGKDPLSVTQQQIKRLDMRLYCTPYTQYRPYRRLFMTWRDTVSQWRSARCLPLIQ